MGVVVGVAVEQVEGAGEHREQGVEVVGDDEHGHLALGPDGLEQLDDLALVAHVEVGEGLVEQEQVGLRDEGLGDGDALLLAAGEGRHALVGEGEGPDRLEGVLDASPVVGAGPADAPPAAGEAEADEVAGPHRVADGGGVVLGHVADAGVASVRGLAQHRHRPGRHREQAEHDLQQGGLARAVGPDHHDERPAGDGEVAVLPDRAAASGHRGPVQLDRRRPVDGRRRAGDDDVLVVVVRRVVSHRGPPGAPSAGRPARPRTRSRRGARSR